MSTGPGVICPSANASTNSRCESHPCPLTTSDSMSGTITKPPPNVTVPMRRKMEASVSRRPNFNITGIAASGAKERRRKPLRLPRPPPRVSSTPTSRPSTPAALPAPSPPMFLATPPTFSPPTLLATLPSPAARAPGSSASPSPSRGCAPSLLDLRQTRTRSLIFSARFARRSALRSSGADASVSTNSTPASRTCSSATARVRCPPTKARASSSSSRARRSEAMWRMRRQRCQRLSAKESM